MLFRRIAKPWSDLFELAPIKRAAGLAGGSESARASVAGRLPASRAGFVFTAITTLLRSLIVVPRRAQHDFACQIAPDSDPVSRPRTTPLTEPRPAARSRR